MAQKFPICGGFQKMPRKCSANAPFLWRSCSKIVPAMFLICGAKVPFLWRKIRANYLISISYADAILLILILIKEKNYLYETFLTKGKNKKYYQLKRLYKEINDIERLNWKAEHLRCPVKRDFSVSQGESGTNQCTLRNKLGTFQAKSNEIVAVTI